MEHKDILNSSIILYPNESESIEMEDSINPLNNEIDTTPEGTLTPAQIVANNTEILSLIFGNVVDLKKRQDIESACKKFYDVCNGRTISSYFQIEDLDDSRFVRRHNEGNVRINIFGRKMTIKIPKEFLFNENNMDIFGRFFRKYLSKVDTLVIKDMSLKHVDFFVNLNCFEKIKNVFLYSEASMNGGDVILSKCSTLNPVNLVITTGFYNFISAWKIDKDPLSESVKTIRLDSESLEWLLENIETGKLGTFDNFIHTEPLSWLMRKVHTNQIYLKLILYFKNISCEVYGFETVPNIEELNNTLLKNNIGLSVTITFDDNDICGDICLFGEFQRDRIVAEYIQILENPENRFLAQEGVYLNIKKLKILDVDDERINLPFFHKEIELMTEDISRMKCLSLFVTYFRLFGDPEDFEKLCTALGRIQTIRIHFCSKITLSSLIVLSTYARNLKNISLVGIEDQSITTSIILSHFKTLESLEIIFGGSYNTSLIFHDLMKFDNASGSVTFKWPKIQHLNIICNRPNFEEEKLINEVKINTPRKSGQLLMRDIDYYDYPAYQILVRLSKKSHIFDSPLCGGTFNLSCL
uniref:F-box domain-containing protein n=1 Tax=Strongyloides papillosus TaxID=174720 RepID=A0A0N5BSH6_STREA